MRNWNQESVGWSRTITSASVVALGLGLSLAVQSSLATAVTPWLGWADVVSALVFGLLLWLVWLNLPGDGDLVSSARAAGHRHSAMVASWWEVAGWLWLSAFLVQAAARQIAMVGREWLGFEIPAPGWVPLIVGLVAINELIGTRIYSRALSVALWSLPVVWWAAVWVWPDGVISLGPETPIPPRPLELHRAFPIALGVIVLWGPYLVLGRRPLMLRQGATQRLPLFAVWAVPALVAAVAYPSWRHVVAGGGGSPLLRLPIIVLCLFGLSQSMAAILRLCIDSARHGVLPAWTIARRAERGAPLVPLIVSALTIALGAYRVPALTLAAASAFSLLMLSLFLVWPRLRRSTAETSAVVPLPLGPVLPTLTLAFCSFFALLLARHGLWLAAVWPVCGALFYALGGRRAAAELQMRDKVIGELDTDDTDRRRIMVAVGEGSNFHTLIQVAACVAVRQNAELLVLHVEQLSEQVPLDEAKDGAAATRRRLKKRLAALDLPAELVYRPLVRLAPSISQGILAALGETDARLLVLGRGQEESTRGSEPVVETVFPATSKAVAVVHGVLPAKLGRVLVAAAGGPHGGLAVEVARALASVRTRANVDGRLTCSTGESELGLINVVTPLPAPASGLEAIRSTLGVPAGDTEDGAEEEKEPECPVAEILVEAPTVADGLSREVRIQDALIMGASVDRLLGQTRLEGFSSDTACSRRGLTLIVKRDEAATRFLGRRIWEWMSNPLPKLSNEERVKVQLAMRRAARADIDFYILISLSAGIATLGLMQSSAAVVIGAMLVAPLMSPILGMGHAVVRGHLRLVRRAASSTVKGVGIAVAVGAVFPLLFPGIPPTQEMLARGAPSLLDLAVALVSGMAAAYAVSRPSVAAALPGVAIAAALVPPLCVVGYGLGASELALAGGALLLFTTNLCAIVLASAAVFVMMGFRPSKAHREEAVWRSIVVAALGLSLISVPLTLQSRSVMTASQIEGQALLELQHRAVGRFQVENVRLTDDEPRRLVVGVRCPVGVELPRELFDGLKQRLEAGLGEPVQIEVTVSRYESLRFTDPADDGAVKP